MLIFFDSTDSIVIGLAVFDRTHKKAGVVRKIVDREVVIERPGWEPWRAGYRRLRPATRFEIRQLAALHKLYEREQRDS